MYAVGAAASTVISQLFDAKPEITKFADFAAVDRIYARGTDKSPIPKEKQGEPNCLIIFAIVVAIAAIRQAYIYTRSYGGDQDLSRRMINYHLLFHK